MQDPRLAIRALRATPVVLVRGGDELGDCSADRGREGSSAWFDGFASSRGIHIK